jgi:hypothetical protein
VVTHVSGWPLDLKETAGEGGHPEQACDTLHRREPGPCGAYVNTASANSVLGGTDRKASTGFCAARRL